MERGPGDYALKPAGIGAAEPNKAFMHDWWNGRRASLRGWCLQRREGSSPLSCTCRADYVSTELRNRCISPKNEQSDPMVRGGVWWLEVRSTSTNPTFCRSGSLPVLYPISLTDRACGYGPQDVGSIPTLGAGRVVPSDIKDQ